MTVCIRLVQINLNRSWQAFDLLKQFAYEADVGLLLISEPPLGIVASSTCFVSTDGMAAILWRPASTNGSTCRLGICGVGFVEVILDKIRIISCYTSSNANFEFFSKVLDDIARVFCLSRGSFLIGGDFNSRSVLWGSLATDRRGELVETWASALNLVLLNEPRVCTCVRPQGSSIVDLTWGSACLVGHINEWAVLEDFESLSDHLYIGFSFLESCVTKEVTVNRTRWNFSKMNHDLFVIGR